MWAGLAALKANQHLRSQRILCRDDGSPVTAETLKWWVMAAQRKAGLTGLFFLGSPVRERLKLLERPVELSDLAHQEHTAAGLETLEALVERAGFPPGLCPSPRPPPRLPLRVWCVPSEGSRLTPGPLDRRQR